MGAKSLEVVLAHYYARAEKGKPLTGGPEEESILEMSAVGRGAMFRKISAELRKGRPLSQALETVGQCPAYLRELIRKGEESGRLVESLRLVLHQYSLFSRFRFHIKGLYLYVLVVLFFLFGFLTFTAFEFKTVYESVSAGILSDFPALGPIGALAGARYFLLILAVIAALATIFVGLDGSGMGSLVRFIPKINRSYRWLVSLELGTLFHSNLETGGTPQTALAEAVRSASDNHLTRQLERMVSIDGKSGDPTRIISSSPDLAGIPFLEAVGVGLAAGHEKEIVAEHNDLVFDCLSSNLSRDMRQVFSWVVAGCGVLVGISVAYVFSAIIHVYEWPLF